MSLALPQMDESRSQQQSQPALSSNNPFRNRTASPSQLSPLEQAAPSRPVSRNPFLDVPSPVKDTQPLTSSSPIMAPTNGVSTSPSAAVIEDAGEIFDNLTLQDKTKPASNGMRPPPPPRLFSDKVRPEPSRAENIPPRGPPMHRPTRSQEEAMRARKVAPGSFSRPRPPTGELNIFADPSESGKSTERRVRRNSESSIGDRNGKPTEPDDEEKKRQDRRRRERRHREAGKDQKNRKPDRKLDIIDQLDATSIYGTGLFHHDGPFDACNPHRNRQGSRRAPMQAFPKDSLNNVLGGGGPLNRRPDHATFLGHKDEEAFKDYSTGGAGNTAYESYGNDAIRPSPKRAISTVQSSLQKVEPVHGDESLGLGTSTFLEGTPASRIAIQRGETEAAAAAAAAALLEANSGVARKKSFARKIRGMSNARREYPPTGRVGSPEGVNSPSSPEPQMTPVALSKTSESNPFDEVELNEDKKPEGITIAEPETKPIRMRAPSSPQRGIGERLERRITSDGNTEEPKQSMGFLSRVKSLKGPKKPRAEKSPA